MAINSILATWGHLRDIDYSSISNSYSKVGSRLKFPARLIIIQNMTDESLMFSVDGTNDHFPIYKLSNMTIDLTANKTSDTSVFAMSAGESLWVKHMGTQPTQGKVYFSTVFGKDRS